MLRCDYSACFCLKQECIKVLISPPHTHTHNMHKSFVGEKTEAGCSNGVTRGFVKLLSDCQRAEQANKCMSHPPVQSLATCSMHHWLCILYGIHADVLQKKKKKG